jgi:predicted nuclease of predicted toxin-antitoxin system
MKFLLDQDVYAITANFLIDAQYDVVLVAHLGLSQAQDADILSTAQVQGRILITRDRDYGNLVFVQALGAGVIYLRILPSTASAVHKELMRVIQKYSVAELERAFVVVNANGHKFRRTPSAARKSE